MVEILQSTAIRIPLKAYLSSDHISAATGKTIPVTISKNMGAFANPSAGATNATEVSNGWYYITLSITDTATLGPLVVRGTEGTIDDAEVWLMVVASGTDPWLTAVPGAYSAGTAGYILGTNLNATVSSRASQTSLDTIDDLLDSEIAAITAAVTGTLEDSVPADGARPTIRQALYMVVQYLMERSVSGTTVTVNKVDGSTALLTLALDQSASPTSITRTT